MKRSQLKIIIEEVIQEINEDVDMGINKRPPAFNFTYKVVGIDPATGKPFEGHYQSVDEALVIKDHIKNGKISKRKKKL